MISALFFYQLALIALLWLCCMLHWVWLSDRPMVPSRPPHPTLPRRKRSREPKPFVGLTRTPPCDSCAHASGLRPHAPSAPPPRIIPKRGRPHSSWVGTRRVALRYVSLSPPFSTVHATFTAHGAAPLVVLHGHP
jgi:hypothetical protein